MLCRPLPLGLRCVSRDQNPWPLGQCGLVPIRSGNRALVTFDYRLLSNGYGAAESLTGGTQFVTFYQSFTKSLAERCAVTLGKL